MGSDDKWVVKKLTQHEAFQIQRRTFVRAKDYENATELPTGFEILRSQIPVDVVRIYTLQTIR